MVRNYRAITRVQAKQRRWEVFMARMDTTDDVRTASQDLADKAVEAGIRAVEFAR